MFSDGLWGHDPWAENGFSRPLSIDRCSLVFYEMNPSAGWGFIFSCFFQAIPLVPLCPQILAVSRSPHFPDSSCILACHSCAALCMPSLRDAFIPRPPLLLSDSSISVLKDRFMAECPPATLYPLPESLVNPLSDKLVRPGIIGCGILEMFKNLSVASSAFSLYSHPLSFLPGFSPFFPCFLN